MIAGQGWDRTRDRDGTRCFIERFPANLDIAPLACRPPDTQRDFRWSGKIRSGHILNGTGLATNPGGSFRRASCQLARSGPRFRSPMKHGTRGQAGSLSYGAGIRSRDRREKRVAVKTLPARKDRAEQKRLSAGGGDPFSHRERKDPRQPWAVISGPSTGRDGTREWGRDRAARADGVADRLPAKPAGSSEVTGAVGQVDPPGQQKVVPP